MSVLKNNDSTVYFDGGLARLSTFLKESTYSKLIIITDTNTGQFCLPYLQQQIPWLDNFDIIETDEGELNKNIDFCIGIWKMMLDFGADRNSLVLNLGGGVVTDMGSFAASTFKRGMRFVQVPTTLLSQVDASVGGKTGIDLDGIKNLIGTFSQPEAVFIDTAFLNTLPARQVLSGFAEMLKHGIIADSNYFDELCRTGIENISEALVYRSVEIKNEVVGQDPHEKGLRKILNFGHTIGHAVDSYLLDSHQALLHGEAIAAGMICEAWLAQKLCGLPAADLEKISSNIHRLYQTPKLDPAAFSKLIGIMKNDKKNANGQIGFALPSALGSCKWDIYADEASIIESLNYYNSL